MPLRILLVHNFYQSAGGEDSVFRREVEPLKTHGHEFLTLTRDNREIDNIGAVNLAASTVWNRESTSDLRKLVVEQAVDVVHVS